MYSAPSPPHRLARPRRGDGDEPRARLERAHRRQVRRAGLAGRAGHNQHMAVVALVRVGGARLDQRRDIGSRVSSFDVRAFDGSSKAAAGIPMSAMTRSPQWASPGGRISGSFGAASVTVSVASMHGPIGVGGVGRQPRWQVDGDHRRSPALMSATIVS